MVIRILFSYKQYTRKLNYNTEALSCKFMFAFDVFISKMKDQFTLYMELKSIELILPYYKMLWLNCR
jgi:hypothetical protein